MGSEFDHLHKSLFMLLKLALKPSAPLAICANDAQYCFNVSIVGRFNYIIERGLFMECTDLLVQCPTFKNLNKFIKYFNF